MIIGIKENVCLITQNQQSYECFCEKRDMLQVGHTLPLMQSRQTVPWQDASGLPRNYMGVEEEMWSRMLIWRRKAHRTLALNLRSFWQDISDWIGLSCSKLVWLWVKFWHSCFVRDGNQVRKRKKWDRGNQFELIYNHFIVGSIESKLSSSNKFRLDTLLTTSNQLLRAICTP